MALALNDLGGQVLGGPAEGPRPVGRQEGGGNPQNSAVIGRRCISGAGELTSVN